MYYPLVIKLVYLFFYCCFVFGSQLACSTCQWTSGVLSYCAEKSTHVITTRMAAHHVIHVSLCIRAFMISLSLPPPHRHQTSIDSDSQSFPTRESSFKYGSVCLLYYSLDRC